MSTALADAVAPAAGTPAPAAAPTSPAAVSAPAAVETKAASPVAQAPTRLLADAPAPTAPAPTDSVPAEIVAAAPVTLKAPEGATWNEAQAATAKEIEAFAKDAGISQAAAEKLLAREAAQAETRTAAQAKEVEAVGNTWLEQAKAHPEIGGDKLDAAVANAKRALGAWATPEERRAIAESPFANNPLFLAILNRAAKALPTEDTIHSAAGSAAAAQPKTAGDAARALYPGYYKT